MSHAGKLLGQEMNDLLKNGDRGAAFYEVSRASARTATS